MIFCNLSRIHFIIQTAFLVFDNEYMINKSGMKRSTQNMYNTEDFGGGAIGIYYIYNNLVQTNPPAMSK